MRYTVDLWAVGCIFAELWLRKELFPTTNRHELLSLILSIRGTPFEHDTQWIRSKDASLRDWVNQWEYQPGHDLRKIFKGGKPEAIDLCRQMLQINPSQRISIDDALRHPYFSKLHHFRSEKVIHKKEANRYFRKRKNKSRTKLFEGTNSSSFFIQYFEQSLCFNT